MKLNLIFCFVLFIFITNCKKKEILNIAPEDIVTTEYHNQKIEDPYRYMENLKDTSFIKWLKKQKTESDKTLGNISERTRFLSRLNQKINKQKFTITKLKITNDDQYFYLKKYTADKTAKLYWRQGFSGKEELIYDPKYFNKFETKDTYSINYLQPSWDGTKIAISITSQDKEISEIIILNVKNKKTYPEVIKNCWPSEIGGIHWLPDNSSFIYVHFPEINKNSENYILNSSSVIYKLGNNLKKHKILFSKKNNPELDLKSKDFCIVYFWNQNDKYLIAKVGGIGFTDYYYSPVKDVYNKKIQWKPLFNKKHKIKQFFIIEDSLFYKTAVNASNFRICKTSLAKPNFETPEILVDEDENAVITDFTLTKNGLFYVKTKNGVEAKLYHLKKGVESNVSIPKPSGSIKITTKNRESSNFWIEIEGWINDKERYQYDFIKNNFKEENLSSVTKYSELENVIIEEIEVPSHDGVKIPLSIIYKKGIKLNSENRLLITGYGAYGISDVPYLDKYMLHWVNEGGVYASAHVRGGGEKGDEWHKGGYKETKSNTWNDFIACTEYFIDKKYSTPNKIAVWSGSAGGILIGRAITERPDLYAAAYIRAGMLNALRSEIGYNGANNTKEFGTFKDPTEFKSLLEMDAYHHIKNGTKYPATYLSVGMNDARVPAWQVAKFAAKLNVANISNIPNLLSVDFEGGHGFDSLQNKKNQELANALSFLLWQTGHPDYQLKK